MPALAARFAIALGLPPLDLLAYQIHMPSPSKGLGAGTNWGVANGGETGAAFACAGAAVRTSSATARAMRRARGTVRTTNRADPCSLRYKGRQSYFPPL